MVNILLTMNYLTGFTNYVSEASKQIDEQIMKQAEDSDVSQHDDSVASWNQSNPESDD